ncbi:MAG: PAS domain-containing protein [Chloroflexota bacterium]
MNVALPQRRTFQRPTPQRTESAFGADEIFFSTTDERGIIRSGNKVFARVSGYSRAELIGTPHNLIRHPDMPRAVFRLLWSEIGAGRPIAAYVKNMAKTGAYYWVLATVVPCEGGYLSVRIKPSTAFFEVVQTVYQDLLALEAQVEAGEPKRREEAMLAATERLGEHLNAAGFANYEAFMRTALLAEVKDREARHAAPAETRQGRAGSDAYFGAVGPRRMLAAAEEIERYLQLLVGRIDEYTALNEELGRKVQFALDLGDDVKLFALNALLAAARLSGDGAALGAVAGLIQAQSDASAPLFESLTGAVMGAADRLGTVLLPVAIARLQAESISVFIRELLDGDVDRHDAAEDLGVLTACLSAEVAHIDAALVELDAQFGAVTRHVGTLKQTLGFMRALELNGRIEASRAAGAQDVVTLFHTIAERLAAANTQLDELVQASRFSFGKEILEARRSRKNLNLIRETVASVDSTLPAIA